jgi:hypothetical protein
MSISRYPQNSSNLIYLPTVEACNAFNINRIPASYPNSTGPASKTLNQDSTIPGPQYTTLGTTASFQSKQNLTMPSVNTRDIVIEVLGNSPYTIQTQTSKSGVTTSVYTYSNTQSSTPIYTFSIAPTNPSGEPFELEIAHEHEWGTQSDIFSSIVRGAASLIGNADDFIQKLKNTANTTSDGKGGFQQLPNRRFDLAETYSTTAKQHITIPFTLFTPGGTSTPGGENFLRDIFDPITLLTSISYPARSNQISNGPVNAAAGNLLGANTAGNTGTGTPSNAPSALQLANAIIPGFRVFVSDPPSYVNCYHQGGLFSYKNCYIKKFSYKLKQFVDGTGSPAKNITSNPAAGMPGLFQAISQAAALAYPVIAECSLEIGTTEPLFSDDFIALSNDRQNASQTTGGLTTVHNNSITNGATQNS